MLKIFFLTLATLYNLHSFGDAKGVDWVYSNLKALNVHHPFGDFYFMIHYNNFLLENLTEEVNGITYIEEWGNIPGYEGFYKASTFGRIRSLSRTVRYSRWGVDNPKLLVGKICKQRKNKRGYMRVALYKNGLSKEFQVHQLIAKTHLPNTQKKPHINHLFAIKDDNRVHQIEWVTALENVKHALDLGLANYPMSRESLLSKCVYQYSNDGKLIKKWDAIIDARRCGFHDSHIIDCCNGRSNHHSGFIWSYTEMREEFFEKTKNKFFSYKKPILVSMPDGEIFYRFESISRASREIGIDRSTIYDYINKKQTAPNNFSWSIDK